MALTVVKTTALSGTITNAQLAGSIDLTAKVTGTLPIANGGTNSTATTFVNAASNVTGTLPAANGGTGATTFSPGKILQVVSMNYSTEKTRSIVSYAVTGIDLTITPSATSSKILVFGNAGNFEMGNNSTQSVDLKLTRTISASDTDIIPQILNNAGAFTHQDPASYRTFCGHASFSYLDTTNTTSACQYRVYYAPVSTTSYAGIQMHSTTSSITCMEIGA
tara:strand:- start:1283 stop:1945 length:663 start_codon:yes stop_codon:yes gene_type:complete